MPLGLAGHSMVPLGNGQVIIGGYGNKEWQGKIYYVSCANRQCTIKKMDQELKIPRSTFVAIPIPDDISGCTWEGKISQIFYMRYISINSQNIINWKQIPIECTRSLNQ